MSGIADGFQIFPADHRLPAVDVKTHGLKKLSRVPLVVARELQQDVDRETAGVFIKRIEHIFKLLSGYEPRSGVCFISHDYLSPLISPEVPLSEEPVMFT